MDWKDVAGKISAQAPGVGALIGTIAGGPVGTAVGGAAGKAIQVLAGLFGIDPAKATPEAVDAAIAADPQSLLKLKLAEMTHQEEMGRQQLESEKMDHDQTKTELLDVQNARQREIELAKSGNSNFTFYALGWIVTLSFFGAIVMIIFKPINIGSEMRDTLNMLLGYLAGNYNTVIAYFFGTSKGSADKSLSMDKLTAMFAQMIGKSKKE
jgi:hypothetical protein